MSSDLIYHREPTLARISTVWSGLVWTLLILGTVGMALFWLALGGLAYLFVQSGFITYLRGNAVRVGPEQLPALHERMVNACDRLGMDTPPETYVLASQGFLNALAMRFLRRDYVVLYSDLIDALEERPDALDFYVGHELGHLKRGHVRRATFLAPSRILPLVGAAYARAREYTCDLHGLACCDDPKDAAYALAVLAAGERSWREINLVQYAKQADDATGFWASFHELTSDYPFLAKRMKQVISAARGRELHFPKRHPMAYPVAFLVPSVGAGGAGAGLMSTMAVVAVVGILAAIAIPNFQAYQARAQAEEVGLVRAQVQAAASSYIHETGYLPDDVTSLGLPVDFSDPRIAGIEIGEQSIRIQLQASLVPTFGGETVVLTPYVEDGELRWDCSGDWKAFLHEGLCGEVAEVAASAAAQANPNEVSVDERTCSSAFRESAEYAAFSEDLQSRLRDACNEWKLQAFEQELR